MLGGGYGDAGEQKLRDFRMERETREKERTLSFNEKREKERGSGLTSGDGGR